MKITATFFAAHRKAVGQHRLTWYVARGATVEELLDELVACFPDLGDLRSTTIVSRNHRVVDGSDILEDGDEIALLSPVGGG